MRSPSLWSILALATVRAIAIQTGTPSTTLAGLTASDIATASNSIPGIIHPVPQGASTSTPLLSALTTSVGSLTGVTILTPVSSATTETGVVSTQGIGAQTSVSISVSVLTTSVGSLAGITSLTPGSSATTDSATGTGLVAASASTSAAGTGSGSSSAIGASASASPSTSGAGSTGTAQQASASPSSSASAAAAAAAKAAGREIRSQAVYVGFALMGLGVALAV
ncbi:hypothetical protein B0A54_09987 [Friedmanniomyces endolithicus]|uniref:REJ domain-containing protein n=1 Tax=Friedmanniomyces endolithicus TaxID=329885 RepID=A0A4U0USF0_9PEZI|nr:hypothetical protein LTS09_015207 [Friedmanniomyces endolithicus]KAK0306052.1 hypothetical protein LTR01_006400 [Friedmanniomyces endolithicus]TKA38938.1 hypothetical protein B0A54_09987 [Friedmanniomyces endolithicus]